jgi:hypothetical protein
MTKTKQTNITKKQKLKEKRKRGVSQPPFSEGGYL